jgi:hypothetical protein
MGQNEVSDQLLGRFTPFLLQWYLYIRNTIYLETIQIGELGGEIWRIGSEK